MNSKNLADNTDMLRDGKRIKKLTKKVFEIIESTSSSIEKVEYVDHNLYLDEMLTIGRTRKEV